MTPPLFEISQQYAELGYVCIPVDVTLDGRDKKRIAAPDDWPNRTFDQPDDWEGWTGIAFDCGRSGIVAVDIDTSHGKDGIAGLERAGIKFPPTNASIRSQSGGQHGIYRACSVPLRDSTSKLADDVDIKAFGLLITAPTAVAPGREYTWLRGDDVPVAALPEFPESLAMQLTESRSKYVVSLVDYTPADVTPEQREWALRKIGYKLRDIAEAVCGDRWNASGDLMRIFGLAKTIGEDVEAIGEKALAAYQESGGDDEDWWLGCVARAIRNSKPEDPMGWLPDDRQRSFWDQRPELQHIRQAAYAGMAAPWAVLGALCVRVLADVPPTWRLATGIGDPEGGNLNLYAVLAAESGGGKGIATQVARSLWRSDVYSTEIASGEALPKLFARKARDPSSGDYVTERVRESVIIDAPEFGSLSASGARQGATLTQRLCNGFSGEGLSFAVSDESKNVDVPPNSYRLGVITGVQYGNAGLLLSEHARTTGVPQRFLWFPANVRPDELPDRRPAHPGPLKLWTFTLAATTIDVCNEAKRDMEAAQRAKLTGDRQSPLDGHALYARVKLAYALAVLNGHYSSMRPGDWELSGIVMQVSDHTRQKAVDTLRSGDRKRAEAAGQRDGIRKAKADETAVLESVDRAADTLLRWLRKNPGGTRSQLSQSLRSNLREHLDDALDQLVAGGLVLDREDNWYVLSQ